MKKISWLLFLVLFLNVQCRFNSSKKKGEETTPEKEVKTTEQLMAEEKARQDSAKNAEIEIVQKTAFGNLMFGMEKDSVEEFNEKRQLVGKYNYNFSYSFNGENQLYKVKLSSDVVKVIQFDTDLKNNYLNLLKILEAQYGKPLISKNYPSVFDVQENKKYEINRWEIGVKQINLALQENGLNSYSATCEILDKNMEEIENQRLKNLKNKDIIEASKRF